MATSTKSWLPRLAEDHPGYFKVVASLLLIHLGLALDSMQEGPRNSLVFKVINKTLHNQLYVLTVVHLLVTLMIVVGLYWRKEFRLVRYGCALSLVLFNALAVGFVCASYIYHLSYYAAIASVTLSLSSLAAITEPPVQTAVRGNQSWT